MKRIYLFFRRREKVFVTTVLLITMVAVLIDQTGAYALALVTDVFLAELIRYGDRKRWWEEDGA